MSPGEGRSWGSPCVPDLAPCMGLCSERVASPRPPLIARPWSAHTVGVIPQHLLPPSSSSIPIPSALQPRLRLGDTPKHKGCDTAVMGRGRALCPAPVPVPMALNRGAGLPGTVLPRGACRGPGPSGSLLCFVPQRQWQFGINGVRTPWLAAAWKSFLLLSPFFLFFFPLHFSFSTSFGF